jgi:hypothetical protein
MAAGNTYVAIAEQTLGSAAASVTFSSIPGTYTDLVIVAAPLYSTSAASRIVLNGDTGGNFSATWIFGDGTSAGSFRVANTTFTINYFNNGSTSTPNNIINLQNYSNTTTYKTLLVRNNNAAVGTDAAVGLWRNTSAISTITIQTTTGNYSTGSTFSLYGIASA